MLCEGTEEVRDNKRHILVSQYETFMVKPNEGISEVFERFNRLINDLKLHEKYYDTKELNMKFLLTLLEHLEGRISSLRERDMCKKRYVVLYGVFKTHELKLF